MLCLCCWFPQLQWVRTSSYCCRRTLWGMQTSAVTLVKESATIAIPPKDHPSSCSLGPLLSDSVDACSDFATRPNCQERHLTEITCSSWKVPTCYVWAVDCTSHHRCHPSDAESVYICLHLQLQSFIFWMWYLLSLQWISACMRATACNLRFSCVSFLISDFVGNSSSLAAVASGNDWHDFVWGCSGYDHGSCFQEWQETGYSLIKIIIFVSIR